ncbi:Fluoroacetyl-CoA thioesterase [Burkholderiales bacterium]|nr:Fluoroacetyl-CoA thioesterase [Burkholderiales bacterium]
MSPELQPGLRHVQRIRVSESLTVPALSHAFASFDDMPAVFATALMVGFIEWACLEALRPYLDPGEHTVGTHIDVSHVAATPVGMMATAEVELIEIHGRKLRFKVSCRDELDLIGEGFHERFVIDGATFAARLAAKSAKTGNLDLPGAKPSVSAGLGKSG